MSDATRKRKTVYFTTPHAIEVREEAIPSPSADEILIETVVSAVSAGTELLLYRGLMPTELVLDDTIEALAEQKEQYPSKYGYAAVGRVIGCGSAVDDQEWGGRLVFAFQPHQSHFCVPPDGVLPVPEGVSADDAVFLPNMETAVSMVMDGRPVIGENVYLFGQGIVGLLTTAILARFPLGQLISVDGYPLRRHWSKMLGASQSLEPNGITAQHPYADLSYELSGNPVALNTAIDRAVFSGRIVVGSWYGQKTAALNLGGKFHRQHLQLISSQVSHLHPQWCGRWTKARRFDQAWAMIRQIKPSQLITHRYHVNKAAKLYWRLDTAPETAVQAVFSYGDEIDTTDRDSDRR